MVHLGSLRRQVTKLTVLKNPRSGILSCVGFHVILTIVQLCNNGNLSKPCSQGLPFNVKIGILTPDLCNRPQTDPRSVAEVSNILNMR